MRIIIRLSILLFLIFASRTYGDQPNLSSSTPVYDAALSGLKYPFEEKIFHFTSQGKPLHMVYMYIPAKEYKPVVVLLHGKNFNAAYWEETANLLISQGYGVLMPDQIGFGKSSKPKTYQYSFSALAHNTKLLMEDLKITKAIIIGHSMGGMLATRFTLNYPDMTEKLILINPIGLENYLEYTVYKDVQFFYNNELQKTPEKIKAYQQKNYYDGKWNNHYETLIEPLVGILKGPDWKDIAYVNALTFDMIFTQPVIEEFNNLHVPTILILGTRDRTGPGRNWMKKNVHYELGRYDLMKQHLLKRNSTLLFYELEGLGHLPHIEDFTQFKPVFLKALSHKE